MTIKRVQVTIPALSAIPADEITNTWYYTDSVGHDVSNAVLFSTFLINFYEEWNTFRSDLMAWSLATYKVFDIADSLPRTPFATGGFGLSATAAASALPTEVALCMSYQAAPSSGVFQQRRRGRVYLGPLASVALDSSTGRPNTSLLTAIATGASNLVAAATASAAVDWVVYSGTTGATQPGVHTNHGTGYLVDGGWVDNAWDTQRRRGVQASARSNF